MRAAFALQILVAACALCAPQQFTTDSNLEQFPTVINPSQTSLFPDPPFTIPLPPGQTFPFPSGSSDTASVTYPTPETPSRTNTPPSVTPTTTPSLTASQSLPTIPTVPVTLEPSPTEPGTGAALTIRAQPVAVLLLVAGVSAALL